MNENSILIINEAKMDFKHNILKDIKYICFENESKINPKTDLLFGKLKSLKFRDKIETLTIEYNSSLEDLNLLEFFPNVEKLLLYGSNIKNLKGIEKAKKIKYIIIETEKNRRRLIDGIENLHLDDLEIRVERREDIEVISNCLSLNRLTLRGSFDFNIQKFSNLKISELSFIGGRYLELNNLKILSNLRKIQLGYCSKLEAFGKDNDNIVDLDIESCNKLNFTSIGYLSNLEKISIRSQKKINDLEWIKPLGKLLELEITGTQINNIDFNPIIESKNLNKVWLSVSNKKIKEIGIANKNVKISNGDICISKGANISIHDFDN